MPARIDLTGQRFGRLTVVSLPESNPFGSSAAWVCLCDCGTELLVRSALLRKGHTKSCGCLRADATRNRRRIDGRSTTRAYGIWGSMVGRCRDIGNTSYARYGGRGITVCERWKTFENFLADMGEPPKGLSLDRIDNNGPYSPDNCRWASVHEQLRNRRTTRFLTYNGQTKTHTEWERELGLTIGTIHNRIRCFGNDPEKLLFTGQFPGRRGRGRNNKRPRPLPLFDVTVRDLPDLQA